METKIDVIALIVLIFAFSLSMWQFIQESNRQKKESTLNAYSELQKDVFDGLHQYNLNNMDRNSTDWTEVTKCLAKIEKFSVGVNTKIYSIEILNRLGGGFFVEQFKLLYPIIKQKRKEDSKQKHYDEFEKTVRALQKKRGAVKQSKCVPIIEPRR